ncbi:response regulator transcription factor [Roseateles sp. UC29_93]|uniref:response regulator transcription factor n=1 Tax=Roseateles sp. UC29_93 TaxID=3350177 RepID=UPI00031D928D
MDVQPASAALTCFLVEDNAVIRENLVATLEEMVDLRVLGHAVDENGALNWLSEDHPGCDLLIIDIFLAQGTGLNVLRAAGERMPGARRVVLSNYATPDMRQRCFALGADKVFDKSAELEDLLAYCGGLVDAANRDAGDAATRSARS